MIVTVEISMYPLHRDYENDIILFIQNLKKRDGLSVLTTAMSTYVKGEYSLVMSAITEESEPVFSTSNKIAMVLKVLNAPLPVEQGYLEF
jgi:uncharacterized protein YqgV (UPF0045/DUF77 family)